jgi:phage gp36-like protein
MSYSTVSELLVRFKPEEMAQRADDSIPRLVSAAMLTTAAAGGDMSSYTSDEQAATAAALANLQNALQTAEDKINGYLQGRYPLPLASVPRILAGYCCDMARYELYDDQATELIVKRNADALKFLVSVSKGEIGLGLDTGNVNVEGMDGASFVSQVKVFGRDPDRSDGSPGGGAFI